MVRRLLSPRSGPRLSTRCRPGARCSGASVLLAVLLVAAPLLAQPDSTPEQRAAAVTLFDEARGLMAEKNYRAACEKLEKAKELARGLGILFHLADCYEKVGRTASGWAGFREVSALARNEGQTDRADDAQRRAEALEPRLIKLLLVIPSPAPAGLVITRNGEAVPEPLWGSSVPVDPGSYTIVAEATGRRRHEVVVDATEPGAQLRVEIPTLAPSEASDATDPATLAAPKSDEGAASSNSWQAPLGIASFAVGGAVALGAGALAIAAKARANAADCDEDNLCSSQGVDDRASARTMGDVATVMLIAGGVVGAAGLVIWLTAPSEDDAETERSALSLELHPTALSLSLRF